MKKILLIIGSLIILIFIGVVIFINKFTHSPLPDYNKDITISSLNADVEVYRDENGIPHIIAQNEHDLYLTAGYVTAQDRMWQMDLIRRATQGKLSEIFGKDFFKTDILLRALQITEKSEMIYDSLDENMQNALLSYSEGVNQYLEDNKKNLPIEFKILGYTPEKWLPTNSLNIIGYIAWDLVSAWSNEIILFKVQNAVDSSIFKNFIPNFDGTGTIYHLVDVPNTNVENNIDAVGSQIFELGNLPFMASNNWAVSGSKSVTGQPILCNDMHLGFGSPGIWYQMHLMIKGEINVTGLSIPGAPGIVAGHNEDIAWGLTNVMLDGSDFYIETINEDSTKYFIDGQWKDLRIEKEIVYTKEGDTLIGYNSFTHRGPIISKFKKIEDKAISMHWVGYEYSNEYAGVYKLNRAQNWDDFKDATSNFGAVAQNIIYADKQGNIGIQLSAMVPKRIVSGYTIFPGDTSLYDWKGFIPFDSLPFEYNPERGYIASANNKSTFDVDYYISQYYFQDFRYRRICQMLEAKDKISVDDMKEIQADQHSALADDILEKIIFEVSKLNLSDEKYKKTLDYLAKWDGTLTSESIGTMIFEQFNIMFIKETVADEMTIEVYNEFDNSKVLMNNILIQLWSNKESVLFDNINTPDKKESIEDIIAIAYQKTLDTLSEQLGENPDKWQFGKLHTLTIAHPLGKVNILDKIFKLNRGPYAVGGSNHTVSPYSYPFDNNFKVTTGASHRHIFPVDDWEAAQTIIPTGNSGQPASKFYLDQTERYLNNEYHEDYFSIERVKENAKYKMTFRKK
ncbi:MAG: penicillin acylase family protein [Bacteroidales bacterium]|nr:penicillin acylase family protein [Bacteroidales bacterium]